MYTKNNTIQAAHYDDDNIRECPRCYGSGVTLYRQTYRAPHLLREDFPEERKCDLCGGYGVIALQQVTDYQPGRDREQSRSGLEKGENEVDVTCGRFRGDFKTFKEKVTEAYPDVTNEFRIQYEEFIEKAEKFMR